MPLGISPALIIPGRKARPVGGRTVLNERSWQAQGMLHFWPVNEGRGELARDFGMVPKHGVPTNNASNVWVPGKTSSVITPGPVWRNHSNAVYGLNCGKLKHLVGKTQLTIACWAYNASPGSRDGFWGAFRYLSLNVHFTGTTGFFVYVNNAEGFPAWATPSPAKSTTDFQHLVVVLDLGESTVGAKLQFYIDGVNQGAGAAPLIATSLGSLVGTTDFYLLGGDATPGDCHGTHFCMWDYAMSADQVKALYTEPWDLYAEDLNRQYSFPTFIFEHPRTTFWRIPTVKRPVLVRPTLG